MVLVGILGALALGLVFQDPIRLLLRQAEGLHSRAAIAEYEARVLPTREDILNYLDGKVIVPTDAGEPEPITLKKGAIEGLAIRREDHFFTYATFTAGTDRGPYALVLLINHNPSDGTFMFDGFRVEKATRR